MRICDINYESLRGAYLAIFFIGDTDVLGGEADNDYRRIKK